MSTVTRDVIAATRTATPSAGAATALPADHPPVAKGRIGVLLVNLGTPDGTDYWSMRRYLQEFLSDRRVIEINPLLWQVILHGVILTFRPSKSGEAYKAIWCQDTDESPLRKFTRRQGEKLGPLLKNRDDRILVDWAMRYGKPPIAERLTALREQGCERVLLCPLYPQYSASTTATVNDKAFETLKTMRWQPAVRTLPPYHDDPTYIDAVAESVSAHYRTLDWKPEVTLLSFHGLPKAYLLKGDPYHCHCAKTARLLRERMGLDERQLQLSFQSRFGRTEWLKPYTDETVAGLAQQGVKNLAVATPGFVSDCVETLEEIGLRAQETFMQYGGERFTLVPCLNDSPLGLRVLEAVIGRELAGWVDQ